MAKYTPDQPRTGPKCPICDELLNPGDRVMEIQQMYSGDPRYTPTAVNLYPDRWAHLSHFIAAPDLRESKG